MHCCEDEYGLDLNREKRQRIKDTRRKAIMPSAHYETIAACLQENIKLLSDALGEVRPENKPLWNISNAVLALSDALQDEFIQINTRLTFIEHQLNR
jgi:hypothetical protein